MKSLGVKLIVDEMREPFVLLKETDHLVIYVHFNLVLQKLISYVIQPVVKDVRFKFKLRTNLFSERLVVLVQLLLNVVWLFAITLGITC